jgi:tetratricopeptide (TPR) repeat protein
MEWPLMVDRLDVMGVTGVPVVLFIDEYGIIRAVNPDPSQLTAFMEKQFPKPDGMLPGATNLPVHRVLEPKPVIDTADGWREHGDALVLWGGAEKLDQAITAYEKATALAPQDASAQFRLGVAYCLRHDSAASQAGDFAQVAAHWNQAIELNPNQYIWRRRIQQYGPLQQKPYGFYDWVNEARSAIQARGEKPIPLAVEPTRSETAQPLKEFTANPHQNPDPEGRVQRDTEGLIAVETAVLPVRSKPGEPVRVHLSFRPNLKRKAHWNNEVQELVFWINLPAGWQADHQYLTVPNPPQPASQEIRTIEMELKSPLRAETWEVSLAAFALYYVCEDVNGVCFYRRQDIPVKIRLMP